MATCHFCSNSYEHGLCSETPCKESDLRHLFEPRKNYVYISFVELIFLLQELILFEFFLVKEITCNFQIISQSFGSFLMPVVFE